MRALFGANLRQARLKAKLTQTDVQQLTGIRQHYISEIENGVRNLTLDTMTTLAQAIGTVGGIDPHAMPAANGEAGEGGRDRGLALP